MKKVQKEVPVLKEVLESKELFITEDGREFEKEEDALEHEHLDNMQVIDISDYFPCFNTTVSLVYFENEKQVELFEQKCSGNKDDNTWDSWVSQKEKFANLPKWMACSFEHHNWGNDFTAHYYTLEQFKYKISKILEKIDNLQNN